MSRTATVHAHIEPELKQEVDELLQRLGLSTTEAIHLYYNEIKLRQGLPFQVNIPNQVTQETFDATDRGEEIHEYDNLEDMFNSLDKC